MWIRILRSVSRSALKAALKAFTPGSASLDGSDAPVIVFLGLFHADYVESRTGSSLDVVQVMASPKPVREFFALGNLLLFIVGMFFIFHS